MEYVYPVCPRQVCRPHLSQDRAATLCLILSPRLQFGRQSSPAPTPGTGELGAQGAGQGAASACTHLTCSPGSSPGAGEKRARGEGQTQGPHGGACSSFPQRNPVDVSRTQTCGGPAWNEPRECPKMLSLLHHNITMLNKHHLCLCLAPQ